MVAAQVLPIRRKFSEKVWKPPPLSAARTVFLFGPFRLDLEEGVLRRSGRPVHLFPKAVELLGQLVAAGGNVVRKERLMEAVWRGTFVEEGTLSKNISFLRKALGSRPYIETVSRRGYRFAGPVQEEAPSFRTASQPTIASVAMLPFHSADPSLDYLGEGLTDSLIARLSRLSDLKVMASSTVFRFKGSGVDPRRIARELKVDAVLCGRLGRHRRKLELAVELCHKSGARLWGRKYLRSRSELPAWDSDLAQDVAAALDRTWTPTREAASSRRGASGKAYDLYLKGLHQYNKRTPTEILKSTECFRRALDADPLLALAHVGLGMAYSSLSWVWVGTLSPADVRPVMEAATSRALELDSTLPEAHVLQGSFLFWHHWKWREAEKALLKALALNAQCVLARQVYGFLLTVLGRVPEAEAQLTAALELDPLSIAIHINLAWLWYVAGRYDKAMEKCRETLELEPDFGGAYLIMALCLERQGRYSEALELMDQAYERMRENTMLAGARSFLLGRMGLREEASACLAELERLSKSRYVSAFDLAFGYSGLGDSSRVLAWLLKARKERCFGLLLLKGLPLAEVVGSDPRFAEIIRSVGFPV